MKLDRLVGRVGAVLVWFAISPAVFAQQKAAQPVPQATGATLYRSHCASCHGLKARGDGPVAQALQMKPADLTELERKNNGKFPAYRVEKMLGGTDDLPVHGSKQMPVWGPAFSKTGGDGDNAAARVKNLVEYLRTIQIH